MLIKAKVIKVDFTCTTLGRGIYSRLVVVSLGRGHTRNRTVSLGRKLTFSRSDVGVHYKNCNRYTSTSVIMVYTNTGRGPARDELRLLRGGTIMFSSVIPGIIRDNFRKVFLITAGPISVVAQMACRLSKFGTSGVVNAKAALSATQLECLLNRCFRISPHGVRTCMVNRRKSDRFIP